MEMMLEQFAASLATRFGVPYPNEVEELTSFEVKSMLAADLIRQTAAKTFVLDGSDIDAVARIAACPLSREVASDMILSRPFRNRNTTWAGEGVTPALDQLLGDRGAKGGGSVAVVVPAYWSTEVWGGDRDWTDEGPVYSHWCVGKLPAVTHQHGGSTPLRTVWLSGGLYGTVQWGPDLVHLSGGRVVYVPAP